VKDDDAIGHVCRRCGKQIAEQKDPQCCACRYGAAAAIDHVGRSRLDAYEHMTIVPIGYRLFWSDDWFSSDNREVLKP
jgi:ribosomal protein L37E